MILRKALSVVAAVAALAAAAAVCVVAAAFALYAVARDYLSPAGASAAIAVLAAILVALLFFFLLHKAQPRPLKREEENLTTRLVDLARDRPIIAAGAAVAAGLVLLRNPGVIGAALSATMANRAREAGRREGRRERRW